MKKRILLSLALFGLCASALATEECGWLPVEKLNQAFPENAPWEVLVGGKVGHCKFTSDPSRYANIFGAIQTVESSPAAAEKSVRDLKTEMAEDYLVEPAPALGKEGFVYRPKDEPKEGIRSMFFVGYRKNVTVTGSLNMQEPISAAKRQAAEKLLQAALAVADDKVALAAASKCRYFDSTLIRRLLPGKDYNENVYGENSCMAQAGGRVVVLAIDEHDSAESAAQVVANIHSLTEQRCTSEPVPSLGKSAILVYNCGRPNATVRYLTGPTELDFTLSTDPKQPTAADRALLVQLAEHAANGR